METVRKYIDLSTKFLEKRQIESARFHAEQLLAECLKIDRVQLYMRLDYPLADNEIEAYRKKIKLFKELKDDQKMTVRFIFKSLQESFNKNNIPEAELSARYIIAHHLQIKPIELAMHYDVHTA